jgi:sec-independent protein translocase protein TatA
MTLGPLEIGAIVVLAFLLFGPKRLPALARSIGESIREFKQSLSGGTTEPPADDPASAPAPEKPKKLF